MACVNSHHPKMRMRHARLKKPMGSSFLHLVFFMSAILKRDEQTLRYSAAMGCKARAPLPF